MTPHTAPRAVTGTIIPPPVETVTIERWRLVALLRALGPRAARDENVRHLYRRAGVTPEAVQ